MGIQIILQSLVLVSKIAQFESYAAGLLELKRDIIFVFIEIKMKKYDPNIIISITFSYKA